MSERETAKQNKDVRAAEDGERKKLLVRHALLAGNAILLVLVLAFAMSAAWYTNVAKEAELRIASGAWGFDSSKIAVSEEPIQVLAGQTGVLPIEVDNSDSSERLRVNVLIDKEPMEDEELRKRIYFYADTQRTVTFESTDEVGAQELDTDETQEETQDSTPAQETVSRVYVGATDDRRYTYTIRGGEKLTLSDVYQSDVPIYWTWVNDLEGYYFYGTVSEEGIQVEEYLQPISYDLDAADFGLNDGETEREHTLQKVNGQTAEEFLMAFSETDGYPGTIDVEHPAVGDGRMYYLVSGGENGTGVWAYLCTYEEIQKAIEYDTEKATNKNEDDFVESIEVMVNVTVIAQNLETNLKEVSTLGEFTEALQDPDVDVVRLSGDVTLTEGLTLEGSEHDVTIDLNHEATLTLMSEEKENTTISVANGARLTVMNGIVMGGVDVTDDASGQTKHPAFLVTGGELSLSKVVVTGVDTAVNIADMVEGNELDSVVRLTGCTMKTLETSVVIQGNGSATETATKVIIQDSKIESGYIGISGNGTNKEGDRRWGTELTLLDSTVSGTWASLYQPQQSASTKIYRSTLTGYTGLAVKGGSVTVVDSSVSGTGDYQKAANSGGGFTDTGDGLYVEATYPWSANVILKGTTQITSEQSYAVELFGTASAGPGKILICGGTYTGAKGSANFSGEGIFEISGGTFDGAVSENIETSGMISVGAAEGAVG